MLRVNPFRTAVPLWGQSTQSPSSLSPKRDCGSKRVKKCFNHVFEAGRPGACTWDGSYHACIVHLACTTPCFVRVSFGKYIYIYIYQVTPYPATLGCLCLLTSRRPLLQNNHQMCFHHFSSFFFVFGGVFFCLFFKNPQNGLQEPARTWKML